MNIPEASNWFQQNYKKLGGNTIRDLESVCPKQAHSLLFFFVVVKDSFAWIDITILISDPTSMLKFSLLNVGKNVKNWKIVLRRHK